MVVGLGQPAQHRGAGGRAQALLGGPQSVLGRGHVHHLDLRQRNAGVVPAGRVQPVGWGDYDDAPPGPGQSRQRRQHQRQFTNAISGDQHFRHTGSRPAAAGQACIQCCMAGRVIGRYGRGTRRSPLDSAGLDQFGKGDHGRHQSRLTSPQYRPSMAKSASRGTSIGR